MRKDSEEELDYYKIGQRIRKYRKSYNMSQEELAENVNISTTHLSHIETGNTKLSLIVIVKIANALSVSTDDLLNDKASITKNKQINEIETMIEGCSVDELRVITDTVKTLSSSIKKHLN